MSDRDTVSGLWTMIQAAINRPNDPYVEEELARAFAPEEPKTPEGEPGSFPPWLVESLHGMDRRLHAVGLRLRVAFDGGPLVLPIPAHHWLSEIETLQADARHFVSFARLEIVVDIPQESPCLQR